MTRSRADLVALDRRHVWRPFASTEDHETRDPLVVTHAEGIRLTDADGRTYLDATGSWWCTHLGHAHPRLVEALRRQAEALPHCALAGIAHEPAAELAETLCRMAPAAGRDEATLDRVFFVDNGSTAVEVALKLAFQYWQQNGRPQRQRFLALPGGYHGDTLGAMSIGALDEVGAVFAPLLFATNDAKPIVDPAGWDAVFDALIARIDAEADTLAGVVVEPIVQGASGMRMYPPAQLARLRAACDRADTFLIADEVFTGLGRTGPMWACELAGIAPDLLAVAKGLSGGLLPFGVTLASRRIHDGFRGDARRAFLHGHTFCGNPLGAAVALEVLRIYEEEDILAKAAPQAATMAAAVERMGDLPGTRFARSQGMVGAIDVGGGGYHGRLGWQVQEAARARGIWLRPLGDTIYAVPPLNVSAADLEELLGGIEESLREVLR
ncbi:MAG: adenosylmethionine--8-amino-7-oxononanoate transaminase [Sandaracinus sp.]|nr:adenosylmethionine--8-amino-7-oxononanoate transaminase [Sandaracinus sp.]|tara:strand:+ start:1077 stop:2393 length:1317 start_codon:yes stop_codon:yes gene_type:complete